MIVGPPGGRGVPCDCGVPWWSWGPLVIVGPPGGCGAPWRSWGLIVVVGPPVCTLHPTRQTGTPHGLLAGGYTPHLQGPCTLKPTPHTGTPPGLLAGGYTRHLQGPSAFHPPHTQAPLLGCWPGDTPPPPGALHPPTPHTGTPHQPSYLQGPTTCWPGATLPPPGALHPPTPHTGTLPGAPLVVVGPPGDRGAP